MAALALGGLVLPAPAFADVSPSDGVCLGKSEAHLYYTGTGELSADLLAGDEPFSGWNTVIGEGPSGGAADDMLVVATLVSDGPNATATRCSLAKSWKSGSLTPRARRLAAG